MREIVCLQVGQCGNKIGQNFMSKICGEHNISLDGQFMRQKNQYLADQQLEKAGVYFQEATNSRYVPRALLVDLDNGCLDNIRYSDEGALYRPENFIHGESSASNIWAKGYYTDGAELIERVLEGLRKETEQCDCLQGFQMTHSVGGGTGGGLGSLIANKLREEYPDRLLATYTVLPAAKDSDVILEPYNSVLCTDQLIECADESSCVDNTALARLCVRNLQLHTPSYNNMNNLVSRVMSATTTCLRFPGQLNADLRKMAVNMIPFPRLHFFCPSIGPLRSENQMTYEGHSVRDLIQQIFSSENTLVDCDPNSGLHLTVAAIFRGQLSMGELDKEFSLLRSKSAVQFADWLPHGVLIANCEVPEQPQLKYPTAASLANCTAIGNAFAAQVTKFTAMFRRRAFVHWYLAEGMEAMEFAEAESNVLDLITEYQQHQDSTILGLDDDTDQGDDGGWSNSQSQLDSEQIE